MGHISDATLEAFVKAWNEGDAATRLKLLEPAWADNAEFSDAAGKVVGRDALSARIDEVRQSSPAVLQARGWLQGLGGRSGFKWRLRARDGNTTEGYALAEVDADGRFTRVASFVEADASAGETTTVARLRAWALANPLATAGLFVLFVYLALRLQTQHFYRAFGVTPEDAGFGPAELVVRQSSAVLLDFARVGIIWSLAYLVVMVPTFYLAMVRGLIGKRGLPWDVGVVFGLSLVAGLLVERGLGGDLVLGAIGVVLFAVLVTIPRWRFPTATAERGQARKALARWGAFVAIFGSLAFGTWVFVGLGLFQADEDATFVKDGGWVSGRDYPWRARRVQVYWKSAQPKLTLPPCEDLAYLGEANGRVVLYARREDDTLRLNSADVQLAFPKACPKKTQDAPRRTIGLELKRRVIRASAGQSFRIRYAVKRPAVVRVSLWHPHGVVRQTLDSATIGLNGTDVRLRRPGRYGLVLVAETRQGSRAIARGQVVIR